MQLYVKITFSIDFALKNFVISNNIFDCSNGPVYAWTLYKPEQFSNSLVGNTYYQKMPTTTDKNVFNFDFEKVNNPLYVADSQQKFDTVVKGVDTKATLVKWLG